MAASVPYFSAFAKAATLAACVAFGSSGCKHEEATPKPTRTDLLTAHDWYLTGRVSQEEKTSAGVVTAPWDVFAVMPNCLKDDALSFKADKSFVYSYNTAHCGFNELPVQSTWALTNDESVLHVGEIPSSHILDGQFGGPIHGDLTIAVLTEDILQLRSSVQVPPYTMSPNITTYTYSRTGVSVSTTEVQKKAFTNLTSHKWRMSSCVNVLSSGSSTTTTELFAPMLPCRRDDFLQFNADYTLNNDEGASRCAATDPQSQATNWLVNEKGTIFLKNISAFNLPYVPTNNDVYAQVTDTKLTVTVYSTAVRLGQYHATTVEYTAF